MSIILQEQEGGFFSCCSVKLTNIVNFINLHKEIPQNVDSSSLFHFYKNKSDEKQDITFKYFEHYETIKDFEVSIPIKYHYDDQFENYAMLDFEHILPIVKKYFSPSSKVNDIVEILSRKYNIIYENTIAVYYRGSDKYIETKLASFDDFYGKITDILKINTNLQILVQSDSAQFIDYMKNKNLQNIIIIHENKTTYTNSGIHISNLSNDTNYDDMFWFFSTIIIMSKCKYVVCGSSNGSMWLVLYRGNCVNVFQSLDKKWIN
jgi:hypothetical protein